MRANNIHDLLKKWKQQRLLCYITMVIILSSLLAYCILTLNISILIAMIFYLFSTGLTAMHWFKTTPHLQDLSQIVNEQNANLEYSGQLLYRDPLNSLEEIQKEQINQRFTKTNYQIYLPIRFGLLPLLVLLLPLTILVVFPKSSRSTEITSQTSSADLKESSYITTVDTLSITSLEMLLSYPLYTKLSNRYSSQKDIEIPEGSSIQWKMKFSGIPDRAFVLFSSGDTFPLSSKGYYKQSFNQSDNYRYGFRYAKQQLVSDYYPINVIKDQVPTIEITGLEEYTRLKCAPNHNINFDIDIVDDYGVADSKIITTIAKGQGESVKFREKEVELTEFKPGVREFNTSYQFSTQDLAMEPGDELYFHVLSQDNCPYRNQYTKSATYFIAIEDTSSYEYLDDESMQVDLMLDFFRSQRQIIIDSEHLLSIKNQISKDSFNRMSNELGYDQKMLRLKYGQFMGEESESGIAIQNEIDLGEEEYDHDHDGHEHDEITLPSRVRELLSSYMHDHDNSDSHDHKDLGEQIMTSKKAKKEEVVKPSWVQELSHNHDNMEEATFHNVSIKSKLRAAMSEMWDSELHLRLLKPGNSLPYQYRSLKLLQEIKNHARIYVHRIGFDPPVIKEQEKRLSGDLDEIADSKVSETIKNDDLYAKLIEFTKSLDGPESFATQIKSIQMILSQLAIERSEILPLLSKIQNVGLPTEKDLEELKFDLLKVIPVGDKKVNTAPIKSHELSINVAKLLPAE